jgi:hypothetical protein
MSPRHRPPLLIKLKLGNFPTETKTKQSKGQKAKAKFQKRAPTSNKRGLPAPPLPPAFDLHCVIQYFIIYTHNNILFHTGADVFPPRHSARPFQQIRSSIARLHPPRSYHPSSCCLTTSSPSDFLRPFPSSLLLSSSPAPPSAALA